MDEAQTNTPEQKPETSVSAKWSCSFIALTFLAVIGFMLLKDIISIVVLLSSTTISIILGLRGLYEIKKSSTPLKGTGLAVTGIIFHSILAILIIFMAVSLYLTGPKIYARMMCGNHLAGLGKAIEVYSNENRGRYPDPNKWCDLLITHCEMREYDFWCQYTGARYHSGEKRTEPLRCDYAINPNAGPNSPPDIVLLFETKPGWNQFGGPEILSTDSHKQEGCNILFNDGRVEFVPAKQLGKLKWTTENDANNPDK